MVRIDCSVISASRARCRRRRCIITDAEHDVKISTCAGHIGRHLHYSRIVVEGSENSLGELKRPFRLIGDSSNDSGARIKALERTVLRKLASEEMVAPIRPAQGQTAPRRRATRYRAAAFRGWIHAACLEGAVDVFHRHQVQFAAVVVTPRRVARACARLDITLPWKQ